MGTMQTTLSSETTDRAATRADTADGAAGIDELRGWSPVSSSTSLSEQNQRFKFAADGSAD